MLQFLKRLKLCTKLVPETVFTLKYSRQNFIPNHLHINITYKSIVLQLEHHIHLFHL